MSSGRPIVVLFWTKYAFPRKIKPRILVLTAACTAGAAAVCKRKRKEEIDTFGVPVHMRDVTWASFADSHSFTTQHIVNVHKIIMWSNGQIFPLTCNEKRLTTYKEEEKIISQTAWDYNNFLLFLFSLLLLYLSLLSRLTKTARNYPHNHERLRPISVNSF